MYVNVPWNAAGLDSVTVKSFKAEHLYLTSVG